MFNFIQHCSKRQSYVFIAIYIVLFSMLGIDVAASESEGVSIQFIYKPRYIPYQEGRAPSTMTSVSDDGRYVTLSLGYYTNYVACSTEELLDTQTGVARYIAGGCQIPGYGSYRARVSPDSRYVAITGRHEYVAGRGIGDGNQESQLFMYDIDTNSTKVVSRSPSGEWGNGDTSFFIVSDDSRSIVFRSKATNLVPNDVNGEEDSFVYDTVSETITLISREEENDFYSAGDVSADGRFQVISTADALVPDDTNRWQDVFVQDLTNSSIRRVSVSATNEQGNNSSSGTLMSANGRYIVFRSSSSNLVPNEGSGFFMVVNPFLDATLDNTPTQPPTSEDGDCIIPVSGPWPDCARNGNGTPAEPPTDPSSDCIIPAVGPWPACARNGNGTPAQPPTPVDHNQGVSIRRIYRSSGTPPGMPDGMFYQKTVDSMSDDGDHLIIRTVSQTSFTPGSEVLDIDLLGTDPFSRKVLVDQEYTDSPNYIAFTSKAQISPNGRYVALTAYYNDLGQEVRDTLDESYTGVPLSIYDVRTDSLEVISLSSSGGTGAPILQGISADSRYIIFRSRANDIVPEDVDVFIDSFVYDTINKTVRLIEQEEEDSFYREMDVSSDGRFRVISTDDASLVPDDTNNYKDVFVQDSTGAVRRVSVSATNEQANGHSSSTPRISADGRHIIFFSGASNLVPNDNNDIADLFVVINPFMETETPTPTDGECIIPASGRWPECARNGGGTPAQPPANESEECIIPISGRWPECARNGGGTPAQPPASGSGECIIPVSGRWPECARNGGGTPAQPPVNESDECIIPVSGRWPACARNP